MTKVACIGEVMIQLSPCPPIQQKNKKHFQFSYAGDAYVTAVYLARAGVDTDYVTVLGDDSNSRALLELLPKQGIGTDLIRQSPGGTMAAYMIENKTDGDRSFYYWRSESPARQLFNDEKLFIELKSFDYLYLTGITLAIISPIARQSLIHFIEEFRREGGKVVFDSNFRSRLWNSNQTARETLDALMQQCDVALLSMEDELSLRPETPADALFDLYHRWNIPEVVIKQGSDSVLYCCDGIVSAVDVETIAHVVDTTGAGDAFNAAYLAARIQGMDIEDAIDSGIFCASKVVQHCGAIL